MDFDNTSDNSRGTTVSSSGIDKVNARTLIQALDVISLKFLANICSTLSIRDLAIN